jgi:hypothetical protein
MARRVYPRSPVHRIIDRELRGSDASENVEALVSVNLRSAASPCDGELEISRR